MCGISNSCLASDLRFAGTAGSAGLSQSKPAGDDDKESVVVTQVWFKHARLDDGRAFNASIDPENTFGTMPSGFTTGAAGA
jgi:hypothetical protein